MGVSERQPLLEVDVWPPPGLTGVYSNIIENFTPAAQQQACHVLRLVPPRRQQTGHSSKRWCRLGQLRQD